MEFALESMLESALESARLVWCGRGSRGLSRRGEWSCWNTRCPLKLAGISLSCWSARDARRLEVPTSWVYAAVQVKTAQVLFWTLGFHGWNSRFQPYSSAAAQCDSLWEYATASALPVRRRTGNPVLSALPESQPYRSAAQRFEAPKFRTMAKKIHRRIPISSAARFESGIIWGE